MPGEFPTEPSKDVIRSALNFIRDTGEPHNWPGHTHTPPPENAIVVYLEEFDLPKARHKTRELWARCPICSPEHGKYFLSGKIAWFPDEGVIRLIGGDCYASLVGQEQHEIALADLRTRQRIARDEAFVASQVPFVRDHLPRLESVLGYCRAVDTLRGRIPPRMGNALHSALWRHVSIGGELRVTQAVKDIRLVDGREVGRETEQDIRYAGLAGHLMLHPPPNVSIGDPVIAAVERIRALVGRESPLLDPSSPKDRSLAIRRLTGAWRIIDDALRQARSLAAFVEVLNINTLRTWAALPNSPVTGYFAIRGAELIVGADPRDTTTIAIPAELMTEAPVLPSLSDRVDLD